jgi:DNA-binding NarL/FixJ family response regulator
MHDSSGENKIVGLLVSSDLIFSTKITGTARAMGLEIEVVGSAESAVSRMSAAPPRCVLLDLGLTGLSTEQMQAIVRVAAGAPVLAFGSHVDTARFQQAADAGCTEVMPRSRLAATLPQLLQQYCGG